MARGRSERVLGRVNKVMALIPAARTTSRISQHATPSGSDSSPDNIQDANRHRPSVLADLDQQRPSELIKRTQPSTATIPLSIRTFDLATTKHHGSYRRSASPYRNVLPVRLQHTLRYKSHRASRRHLHTPLRPRIHRYPSKIEC